MLHRVSASVFTQQLSELDAKRDTAFMAFKMYVEACSKSIRQELSDAALVILPIIKTHGTSLHRKSRQSQTASLNSLFAAIGNSRSTSSAITSMGATNWLDDLKASQAEYAQMDANRNTEYANREDYNPDQDYRELRKTSEELMQAIVVLNTIDDTGAYEPFINEINEIIEKTNTPALARATRRENAEEPVDESMQN